MNKKASQFLVLFYVCLLLSACGTKSTEIQISAPLRPKYVAQGYKKLYIADFIITGVKDVDRETRNVNVNKEIKETLKSEFKDKSGYEIDDLKLEVPADRKPDDVLRDPQFWATQNIPNRDSSMIMAGVVEFSNHAKSGLVTEQVVNPRTGTERTITSPKDQLQLVLSVKMQIHHAARQAGIFGEPRYREAGEAVARNCFDCSVHQFRAKIGLRFIAPPRPPGLFPSCHPHPGPISADFRFLSACDALDNSKFYERSFMK